VFRGQNAGPKQQHDQHYWKQRRGPRHGEAGGLSLGSSQIVNASVPHHGGYGALCAISHVGPKWTSVVKINMIAFGM
jgi:hypothetical protein